MAEMKQGTIGEPSRALTNFGHNLLPGLIGDDMKEGTKGTNEIAEDDLTHLIQRIKAETQSTPEQASQLSLSYIAFADQLLGQANDGTKDRQSSQDRSNSSQFEHLHRQVVSLQLQNDSYRKRLKECWELVGE